MKHYKADIKAESCKHKMPDICAKFEDFLHFVSTDSYKIHGLNRNKCLSEGKGV